MGEHRFPFEGTEVFEAAMEVADLADRLATEQRRTRPWLAFQLGKTGLSVVNNTAEAIGEYSPGDKARFFRYALRSGSELGAMIVFMAGKTLIGTTRATEARLTIVKVMKILGRKAIYFQKRSESRAGRSPRGR